MTSKSTSSTRRKGRLSLAAKREPSLAAASGIRTAREVQFVVTFSESANGSGRRAPRTTVHQMEGGGLEQTWPGIHAERAGAWMGLHLGALERSKASNDDLRRRRESPKVSPGVLPSLAAESSERGSTAAARVAKEKKKAKSATDSKLPLAICKARIRVAACDAGAPSKSIFEEVSGADGSPLRIPVQEGLSLEVDFSLDERAVVHSPEDLAIRARFFARNPGSSQLTFLGDSLASPAEAGDFVWQTEAAKVHLQRGVSRLVAVISSAKATVTPTWVEGPLVEVL
ncbi:MAG: hypothetical protein ABSF50_19645 [Burkholderiaceae bacterium]